MNYEQIAEKIPAEYRKEILQTNAINHARASVGNGSMLLLFTVWANYVQPGEGLDANCGNCLQNILNNWMAIKSILVKLEKKSNLIKKAL